MARKTLAVLLSLALLCSCVFVACAAESALDAADANAALTPTNELVLYTPYRLERGHPILTAVERFKVLYPEVDVLVEPVTSVPFTQESLVAERYTTRIATELMAGEGPDVLFLDSKFFTNVPKMVNRGHFADLAPFFNSDPDFERDAYYEPVFDVGLYGDKRFFVPYKFQMYSFVSSKERLEALGIDPARLTNLVSLLEETAKALPEARKNPGFDELFTTGSIHFSISERPTVYEYMLNAVAASLAAGEDAWDSDALRAFFAALKPCYQFTQQRWESEPSAPDGFPVSFDIHEVLDGRRLFAVCESSAYRTFNMNTARDGMAFAEEAYQSEGVLAEIYARETPKATPVAVPFTSLAGEVQVTVTDAVAINANAENKANAYRLIQLLLDYHWSKSYTGEDFVSKELNINQALGFVDEDELNPETDLLAYQVTNVVFECQAVTSILKECMLPFLNDEASYESSEAALHERLRMYWGE